MITEGQIYQNNVTGITFRVTKVDGPSVTYRRVDDESKVFILPLGSFMDSVRLGRFQVVG